MSLSHTFANSLICVRPWDGMAEWQAEMVNRLVWNAMLHMVEEALQVQQA